MNKITHFSLFACFIFALSGCSIPDIPGPIGIPGIEIETTKISH